MERQAEIFGKDEQNMEKQTGRERRKVCAGDDDNKEKQETEDVKNSWRFPLDETKKAANLETIRQAVLRKQIRYIPSFRENIWCQMRFQSPGHWLLQGGILLAALFLIAGLQREQVEETTATAACSAFLVFAGNLCLSGVAGLFSHHMEELEQTLYLNLKQMVCIRMLEAALLDLGILALFAGMTQGAGNGFWRTLFYMLVPFLWSDILYLHLLCFFRSTFAGFRQLSAGALCGMLALFPAGVPKAYQPEYLPVWGLLCIAGMVLLAAEVYRMFGKIERGDDLCLN